MEYINTIRAALRSLVLDQLEELIFGVDLVQDATVAHSLLPKMPRLGSLSLSGRIYTDQCHTTLVMAPACASQIVELEFVGRYLVSSRKIQEILITFTELISFKGSLFEPYAMVNEAHLSSRRLVLLPAPVPAHLLLELWMCRNLERFKDHDGRHGLDKEESRRNEPDCL